MKTKPQLFAWAIAAVLIPLAALVYLTATAICAILSLKPVP